VRGGARVAVFPSNRPLHPLRLEAESGCFEIRSNVSTNISARRMLPWKLCKNWVSYMQSNDMHICVHLCAFVFSLGSEITISIGTLNQSVIRYLFGKMSVDIVF